MERFLGEGPRERNGGGVGGRRGEKMGGEKMSKHIGIPSYLQPYQPCQPQARPESEESILAIQATAPADDSTPHHHLTAKHMMDSYLRMLSQAQLTHKTMKNNLKIDILNHKV